MVLKSRDNWALRVIASLRFQNRVVYIGLLSKLVKLAFALSDHLLHG